MKSGSYIAFGHPPISYAHSAPPLPVVEPGRLHLLTPHEIRDLRDTLARGAIPLDLEAKLARLARGELIERFVEQNSRLFLALLLAAADGSYRGATPAERERLLRVLAYVRKDDDEIPDYAPRGFADDQQEIRAAIAQLSPLLQTFKAWRLTHQVPAMW
jgi:hypothetical protein